MKCLKCKSVIPDNSNYCLICGAKVSTHKPKTRGNSTGKPAHAADLRRNRMPLLIYLSQLRNSPEKRDITLKLLYNKWYPTHRAGKSTMECYSAAWKYFDAIADSKLSTIDIDDLQECLDDCPHGKRTRQNMKALCGLLYKYAIPRHLATLNLGEYLKITAEENPERQGLPLEALDRLWSAVGSVQYADYILCQCYLGFRPSEFLALDVKDYNRRERAFTGGAKTEAGKNRTVTVSPKFSPLSTS